MLTNVIMFRFAAGKHTRLRGAVLMMRLLRICRLLVSSCLCESMGSIVLAGLYGIGLGWIVDAVYGFECIGWGRKKRELQHVEPSIAISPVLERVLLELLLLTSCSCSWTLLLTRKHSTSPFPACSSARSLLIPRALLRLAPLPFFGKRTKPPFVCGARLVLPSSTSSNR